MARPEYEEVLARCPSPEEGCFASDSATLGAMLYMDDAGLRSEWARIAVAADTAATQDLPLEDATYGEVKIEPIPGSWIEHRIGTGETKRIGDLPQIESRESTTGVGYRVAKCAYACGKQALCPLKQPPQED